MKIATLKVMPLLLAIIFSTPALAYTPADDDETISLLTSACLEGEDHDGNKSLSEEQIRVSCQEVVRAYKSLSDNGYCYVGAYGWTQCSPLMVERMAGD